MTISLYSGTPGSGKSLHATRRIRNLLLHSKRPVIANYRVNEQTKGYDRFTYCNNMDMTPQFLYDYADFYWGSRAHRFKEDWILLVIDEAQLLFNSREWNRNNRMEWLEFFSQHRKYGYEIVFIAQFDRMIDRQIRSLIEYECKHRRLGNFGAKGKALTFLTLGELFVCVNMFYPLNERIGVDFFKAHKSIFRMYDSYTAFEREGKGLGVPLASGSMAEKEGVEHDVA